MKVHIETKRLILRTIEESDAKGMFLLDSDPIVHEFLGNNPIKSMEEARETINYIRAQYTDHGVGRLAIIDKKTNDFIGWAGIKYEKEVREDFDYYDIGYRLRKEYWRKGIGTEAAMASMRYGFEELDIKEIYGGAHVENAASNKILRNIGLEFIETFVYDNEPHHWYGVEREEWYRREPTLEIHL